MTEEQEDRNRIKALIVIIICAIIFSISYFWQEKGIKEKLEECSFYTIITPIRMPDTHIVYFFYYYNEKKYNSRADLGAEDLGFFYTKKDILNSRYWVQVSCKDFNTDRVKWEIPVPDTLQYIPANGWDKIPYGLDKVRE